MRSNDLGSEIRPSQDFGQPAGIPPARMRRDIRQRFDAASRAILLRVLLRGVGIPRATQATIILGAGASRGASFVDATRQVLPPLDADFFRQAQRLNEETFRGPVRDVIEFVREEYGATKLPTLETVFTQLQGFDQYLQQFAAGSGPRSPRYKKQLGNLLALISVVFRAAFEEHTCTWHDRIANSLRKGDSIISFNYDTLIDASVSRFCSGIWKADKGYGFHVRDGATHWTTAKAGAGAFPKKNYLRLLKPHGSLHWQDVDSAHRRLRLGASDYYGIAASDNIIPPTWDKTILADWPWRDVWRQASRALQRTRCLIVIGYSVPQTDLSSQALIRSSLSGGDLRLLVVANPDEDARARVVDLARGAIRPHTRIFEVGTLSEFGGLLDETQPERTAREQTTRQLATLRRRLAREVRELDSRLDDLEDRAGALDWHDLDDIDARLGSVEAAVATLDT
ncbi:MAG TPA: hypothetical protein VK790_10315 [Solirubrobacteraceae bacterium]|nr:hypothetical protein [Solirubrobacteraceae bacterium]